jgi:hypothetical protein
LSEIAIVRAAVYLAQAAGSKPSVRMICGLIASASPRGRGMQTKRVMALMREVLGTGAEVPTGNDSEHVGKQNDVGKHRETEPCFPALVKTFPGNARETSGNADQIIEIERDTDEEVANAPSSSPQLALGTSPAPAAEQAKRKPRQMPLPDATEARARDILAVIWPLVAHAVRGAMTRREWAAKYKRVALDLARVDRGNDDIIAAHASICARRGTTVYSLSLVRDELLRLDNPRTNAPAGSGDAAIGNGNVPWSDDADALPDLTGTFPIEAES